MDDPQIVVDAIVKACLDPKEETPVGIKAKASNLSHHMLPDLIERMSANIAKKEAERGSPTPENQVAIHTPMQDGLGIGGGIRERIKREDAAR